MQSGIEEVEVNLYFDEIHQIINKFSTRMVKERAENQFREF